MALSRRAVQELHMARQEDPTKEVWHREELFGEVPSQPISDLLDYLEKIDSFQVFGMPVATYKNAFAGFPHIAVGFLDAGKDALVLELEGSKVLKIYSSDSPYTKRELDPRIDLLPLETGVVYDKTTEPPTPVHYAIVPKATTRDVRPIDRTRFERQLRAFGYEFVTQNVDGEKKPESGTTQIGKYKGKLYLLDPAAVVKA